MINYNPITQLTPIVSLNPNDVIPIVDTSDNTESPVGSTKKATLQQIQDFVLVSNEWLEVTTSPQLLVNDVGFISNGSTVILFRLPPIAAVGDVFMIEGKGVGLFNIVQNVGQNIIFGNQQTSIGPGGGINSTNIGDSIKLLCIEANLLFKVINGPIGNFTIL